MALGSHWLPISFLKCFNSLMILTHSNQPIIIISEPVYLILSSDMYEVTGKTALKAVASFFLSSVSEWGMHDYSSWVDNCAGPDSMVMTVKNHRQIILKLIKFIHFMPMNSKSSYSTSPPSSYLGWHSYGHDWCSLESDNKTQIKFTDLWNYFY